MLGIKQMKHSCDFNMELIHLMYIEWVSSRASCSHTITRVTRDDAHVASCSSSFIFSGQLNHSEKRQRNAHNPEFHAAWPAYNIGLGGADATSSMSCNTCILTFYQAFISLGPGENDLVDASAGLFLCACLELSPVHPTST